MRSVKVMAGSFWRLDLEPRHRLPSGSRPSATCSRVRPMPIPCQAGSDVEPRQKRGAIALRRAEAVGDDLLADPRRREKRPRRGRAGCAGSPASARHW